MRTLVCDGAAWNSAMPSQFVWLPLKDGTELKCARLQEVEYDRLENAEPWIAAGLVTEKTTAPAARTVIADAAGEKKDK